MAGDHIQKQINDMLKKQFILMFKREIKKGHVKCFMNDKDRRIAKLAIDINDNAGVVRFYGYLTGQYYDNYVSEIGELPITKESESNGKNQAVEEEENRGKSEK